MAITGMRFGLVPVQVAGPCFFIAIEGPIRRQPRIPSPCRGGGRCRFAPFSGGERPGNVILVPITKDASTGRREMSGVAVENAAALHRPAEIGIAERQLRIEEAYVIEMRGSRTQCIDTVALHEIDFAPGVAATAKVKRGLGQESTLGNRVRHLRDR